MDEMSPWTMIGNLEFTFKRVPLDLVTPYDIFTAWQLGLISGEEAKRLILALEAEEKPSTQEGGIEK